MNNKIAESNTNLRTMPRTSKIANAPPQEVADALSRLGRHVRLARLRRRLRLVDIAEKVGVSRFVVADVERGKPTTAIAAYLGTLWALGLLSQADALAHPDRDEEGKILERSRTPRAARTSKVLDSDF